jgi:hypothetical protein
MKIAAFVAAAGILALIPSAQSAVLVTTGTTGEGRAYLTVPTVEFVINRTVSASGFNSLIFDFTNVWPDSTGSGFSFSSGSGLSFTDSAHPGVFSIESWNGHSTVVSSFSDRDSVLFATPNTSYTYTVGDVITLQGGTFTLASPNPSFPVFPSGSYDVYFVALGVDGGPLSSAGVAVPEPSAAMLFWVAGLGFIARRRRV